MYIYNVTIKIQPSIKEEWLSYMLNVHIPDVIATQKFSDYRVCHLLNQDEADGLTYVVQYFFNAMEDYSEYQQKFAPTLQKDLIDKFKDRFVAFRTVMEVVS